MYTNMLENVRVSRQDQRVGTGLTLVGKTYRLRRYWRHTVLVSYARTHSLTHRGYTEGLKERVCISLHSNTNRLPAVHVLGWKTKRDGATETYIGHLRFAFEPLILTL